MNKTFRVSKLPQWLEVKKLQRIFEALDYKCKIVGGCVRDIILGQVSRDIDIATPFPPKKVLELLKQADIKAIPTGIKYGTVTAIYDNLKVEITTLRKDVNCKGRDTEVIFTEQWVEDSKRRDFTINAMYIDLDGLVYDYFGGLTDIKQPLVKFIGKPEERIKEDYLRIFRFFRFCARFGISSIDNVSLDACSSLKEGIDSLSGERIRSEMLRLLESKYSQEIVKFMEEYRILEKIYIKDLNLSEWNTYTLHGNSLLKLAMIILTSKSDLEQIRNRWKLSNTEYKYLLSITTSDIGNIEKNIKLQKIAIYRLGKDLYMDILQMKQNMRLIEDVTPFVEFAQQYIVPTFPISAQDVMNQGYEGREISKALKHVEQTWIDSCFSISKDDLLNQLT